MGKIPRDRKGSPSNKAIALSVIFYEYSPDKIPYTIPKGQFLFEPDKARLIQELVIQAAQSLDYDIPPVSFFERSEMFYQDDALIRVRISGKYAVGTNLLGELEVKDWCIPEKPKFTFSKEHGLKLARIDKGKSYIIVLNRSNGTMVWWDFSAQYGHEKYAENDDTRPRLKFLICKEARQTKSESPFPKRVLTAEIKKKVRDLETHSLHLALVPQAPVDSRELLMIKISDPHRLLIYLIDKARVEYDLALRFAQSQRCTQLLIEQCVNERRLSLDQAKLLWVRKLLTEQTVFVRESVESIHEQNWKVLEDVFEISLGGSVYDMMLAEWIPLGHIKEKNPNELKKPILDQEVKKARTRLGMRGKGRIKRTMKEQKGVENNRESKIRNAINDLCTAVEVSKVNVVIAEDMVTPEAVAKRLGMSVKNLYRWLNGCGLKFENLRSQYLEAAGYRD